MHKRTNGPVPFLAEAVQAVTPRTNIGRILAVVADGKWRSINVIKEEVQNRFAVVLAPKGLAAQLRDIRKKSGYVVNVNKVNQGLRGTWEYQVLAAGDAETGPFTTSPDRNIDLDSGVELGQDSYDDDQAASSPFCNES